MRGIFKKKTNKMTYIKNKSPFNSLLFNTNYKFLMRIIFVIKT